MLSKNLAYLAVVPALAMAQLDDMRATIPGSLHQCENTNLFFYDTGASRPLTVLFLPSDSVPDSLRTGTTTLDEAAQYSPLQVIEGIETADAAEYDFELDLEEGDVFEVFGFLPDGSGKALSLTRTVTTPLPSATTSCWTSAQTTVSGVTATASSSSSSSSSTSSSKSSSSSSAQSSSTASSTTKKSSSASTASATSSSAAGAAANAASSSTSSAAATSSTTSGAQANYVASGMAVLALGLAALAVL